MVFVKSTVYVLEFVTTIVRTHNLWISSENASSLSHHRLLTLEYTTTVYPSRVHFRSDFPNTMTNIKRAEIWAKILHIQTSIPIHDWQITLCYCYQIKVYECLITLAVMRKAAYSNTDCHQVSRNYRAYEKTIYIHIYALGVTQIVVLNYGALYTCRLPWVSA